MPILVHGTLASRERAPRRRTRRVANLWVAAFLCGVAAEGCTHRCRIPRSDGVWWRRLQAVQSAKAVLAGNQTLAAMVFQSEAQDKAKSTELMQKRARVAAQAQGAARSSLLLCSSAFQALAHARAAAGFSTIRISLVADGSSTHFDQESGREPPQRHAARAKRELMKRQYLVPEHLQQPSHVRRPVAVALFNIAAELLLR